MYYALLGPSRLMHTSRSAPTSIEPDTVQSTYPPIQNMIAFVPYIAVGILDLSGYEHAWADLAILRFVLPSDRVFSF